MPIISSGQDDSPAIPNAGSSNRNIRNDAALAISEIELADVWRPGTISKGQLVHIDCQGTTGANFANVQIQLNGQRSKNTIAAVLIAPTLAGDDLTPAQQLIAINAIHTALNDSMNWQVVVTLTGNP